MSDNRTVTIDSVTNMAEMAEAEDCAIDDLLEEAANIAAEHGVSLSDFSLDEDQDIVTATATYGAEADLREWMMAFGGLPPDEVDQILATG
ncbi:MAG: hypothetical protein EBT03_08155 [Betaproteobacteria bacterium]|nr:hypothetical protein [Betaproteobacteria bacterium]NCA17159.1 hypothetical protein [Betaproteobacteria bacterium]